MHDHDQLQHTVSYISLSSSVVLFLTFVLTLSLSRHGPIKSPPISTMVSHFHEENVDNLTALYITPGDGVGRKFEIISIIPNSNENSP